MATSKITNISSGIYFNEIDLTLAIQAAGTFAGGSVGLMEKGPAFEPIASASFDERRLRLGDLNPVFPTSYYARQFLEQATNYKEVRILGLEGYNESGTGGSNKGFVVMYNQGSAAPASVSPKLPVIADVETIAAVLKPRREEIVGDPQKLAKSVEIVAVTQTDSSVDATDDLFGVVITLVDNTTVGTIGTPIQCSLRPERKEYIGKVFGEDPREVFNGVPKPTLVQGQPSPLWVEFVIPSVKTKANATDTLKYYYPGGVAGPSFLSLVTGDITIDLTFSYPTFNITGASGTPILITATGHTFNNGDKVTISGVGGNTNANGDFIIQNVTAAVSFELVGTTTNAAYTTGGTAKLFYEPTWEAEVLELGGENAEIEFQTPITPWFVSDADVNGEVKRLFRFWSISDGEAANTEIKIEIRNINPSGNNNKGAFDVVVRQFNDREDIQRITLEAFSNLTLDPKSDNFIKRRIGDGEDFPLRGRFIFVEMNDANEPVADDALPYGVEGYPNLTGISMPDVDWAYQYNFGKPLSKQVLGLANNQINMLAPVTRDHLSFKNVADPDAVVGKGFHLDPNDNPNIDTSKFTLVDQEIYQINPPTNTNTVTPQEKVRRSHYVVCFNGGFDAFNVYEERTWNVQTSKDFEALTRALNAMSDPEDLTADFSVLVTPDLNFEDHTSAVELALEMVKGRGDALYLSDFKYNQESDPDEAKDVLVNGAGANLLDSHNATYFPYVQISDEVNKINVWQPPSLIALSTIAAVATNEQVWQPPAGPLRTVTSNLIRTRRRMKLPDREILKSANINPITLFPGSGFEITESRTTQSFFSALSFVHNRLLLGFAKKALNQTLRPLLHQLNNEITKNAFVNAVTPIFDRIKKLNGVEEFKVVVLDVAEDRTTLHGQIEIVPLYPVERIIVSFILSNKGAEFNQ